MDPFEARLQFQQMLKTITSSNNNNLLITNFLLQNQALQEDFHSCILEALNVDDFNYKVNLFQLIEVIVQKSITGSDNNKPYVKNLIRDFDLIIKRVMSTAQDEISPVNLNSAYTILIKISKLLSFANLQTYQMRYRNVVVNTHDESIVCVTNIDDKTDTNQVLTLVWELIISIKRKSKQDRLIQEELASSSSSNTTVHSKNILRRMEDDRERTKKLKETLWENVGTSLQEEFNDVLSKYNNTKGQDDDFKDMIELNGIVGQCYNDWVSISKTV